MFVGNGEFEGGFDLGLSFYNDFKEMNRSIPIIILTNNEINKIDIEMLKKIQLNNDIIICLRAVISLLCILKCFIKSNSNKF